MSKEKTTVLAIESSCDETAAAVVVNGREVLSNVISSQIGVVVDGLLFILWAMVCVIGM